MQITGTLEELNSFVINLNFWDLSLKLPIPKPWSELVFHFPGTRRVEELDAIPFDLFPNAESTLEELQQRGRKIREIELGGLKWFKGFVNVPLQGYVGTRRRWIEGRVIIDPAEYDKMNADPYTFGVQPPLPLPAVEHMIPLAGDEDVDEDKLAESRSVVRGFSLASKSWHEFEVDGISDIQWNDQVSS